MKKVLSILLSLVLAATSLGAGTAVFAKTNTVNIEYSVYDGEFIKEPTKITVSSDLSEKYGFNDEGEEPTILDATIAAHLEMLGSTDSLQIDNLGWTLTAFEKDASSFSYRVSGNFADGLNDKVKNSDYVEYVFYQDKAYWSDAYTFFNTRSTEAFTKEKVTLTLSIDGYDESWNPAVTPAANANITVNGEVAGKTDENGTITLSFDKVGTYKISAENNIDGTLIFAPWCVINVSTQLLNYVEKEMKGAAAYLLNGTASLDLNSAVDYLTYLKSGYDMSANNDAFVASVKANLDENGGKLKSNNAENIALYGAVIQIFDILGVNAEDFEGYNIVSAFESIDMSASYHPYYYRVAIEAANEEFAKALCDKLIKEHYTLGSGLNNWGFSCDNTAHFLTAIAKYKDSYPEYVEDAKAIIKSYTKSNGAYCDPKWAPDVNADSTALAMMAFASIGDVKTAFAYYKNLVDGFEGKTGVFLYDGEVNLYATKDALLSLEYFKNEVENQAFEHPQEIIKTTAIKAKTNKNGSITKTCVICGKTNKTTIYYPKTIKLSSAKYTYSGKAIQPKITVTDSNNKTVSSKNYTVKYSNNKAVGTGKVTVTFKGNYSGSVTKTFKINPKGTKLSKLTASKKGFTAKWNKQSAQTTGYQLQYATDKNFKKNVKTVTVSKNKTTSKKIAKLKAKKKYFVRVRTYKTVGKTKYYSGWSSYKTVTTKK